MAGEVYTGAPTVQPSDNPPGVYQNLRTPQVSEGMFGGASAQGLRELGQGATRAAIYFGDVAADDAANQYQERINRILHGDPDKKGPDGNPDLGYLGLKGRNALDARPDAVKAMEDLRKEIHSGLLTPQQKLRFDSYSRRYKTYAEGQIGTHADNQTNQWYAKVNKAGEDNWLQHAANNADNPEQLVLARENVRRYRVQQAELNGGGPELIKQAVDTADRDVVIAQANAIAVTDPGKAMRIVENNKAVLGTQYDNVANHFRPRAEQQEGRTTADGRLSGVGGPNEHNIGNVRPKGGGPTSGFQQVSSFDEGVALTVNNARAYPAAYNGGKDMSLMQIGARWAPKGDGNNDPVQWAKNVAGGSGLPVDQPIDLKDPETAAKFARGVHVAEWGNGKARPVSDYRAGASGNVPASKVPTQAELIEEGNRMFSDKPQALAAYTSRINQSYALRQDTTVRNRAAFSTRVDNSLAEVKMQGFTDTPLPESEFVQHFGPAEGVERYQGYVADVKFGADYKSMQTMSDVEQTNLVNDRINGLKAGSPAYAREVANIERLQKATVAIQKERREDPAGAVSRMPAVQDALKGYNEKDPSTFALVANARLAAQQQLGIDPEYQSPVTKAEALKLTMPLVNSVPGDEQKALEQIALNFRQLFGEEAPRALAFAVRARHVNAAVGASAATVITKLARGEALTRDDARAMDDARAEAAETNALSATMRDIGRPADGVPRLGKVPATPRVIDNPGEGGTVEGSTQTKMPAPTPQAIADLQQGTLPPAKFDLLFGTGMAKDILERYPGKSGAKALWPGGPQ